MMQLERNASSYAEGGPRLTRGFSFTIMDKKEVEEKQKSLINYVQEYLGVSDAIARSLLIKFLWDKEKLI